MKEDVYLPVECFESGSLNREASWVKQKKPPDRRINYVPANE